MGIENPLENITIDFDSKKFNSMAHNTDDDEDEDKNNSGTSTNRKWYIMQVIRFEIKRNIP